MPIAVHSNFYIIKGELYGAQTVTMASGISGRALQIELEAEKEYLQFHEEFNLTENLFRLIL